ncbi:MAG TPA: NaeI family type II restriction endonuclease [Thermoanaerobaculia bacterium]|nr:NaeI family type II restriction endonuclease [Thermoanaerobaculia bacterium]
MAETHPDDAVLAPIASAIVSAAGGLVGLKNEVGELLRDCIDGVIKTPRTGRRLYEELQNSEKTYIGTCVEIDLRDRLKLAKGSELDLKIADMEVDVKFSGGTSWMIPPEALGRPCIIISANDTTGLCSFGLVIARLEYLNAPNRDQKRSISKFGQSNVYWLFRNEPYPPNFWQAVPKETAMKIATGRSGNERVVTLFREVLDHPISRKVVEDVAAQRDFMRRLRADAGGGARDVLAREGVVLLCGTWASAQKLILELGLPDLGKSEFMSHRVGEFEIAAAKRLGYL